MSARLWFNAQGQSAYARGLPISYGLAMRRTLPVFARQAWADGWLDQARSKARAAS